jgi:predicted TIM-barrel fold metal-dependent hydrolase
MKKRLEGRDEPILDPDLPIIDSHHHLFERPGVRYLHEEYLADAHAGHKVLASVYLEIMAMARKDGPEFMRPLGEVEFANGVGAIGANGQYGPCRVAAGIVGHADLRLGDQIAELLDRCISAAPDRFRGIRQVTIEHPTEAPYRYITNRPPAGVMKAPGFHAGFVQLARRGLTFDAAVFHPQIPQIGRLAAAFPDTTIVLNHCGSVMAMDLGEAERAETFGTWSGSMRELARHDNVVVKIGGFGLPFWDFGFMVRDNPVGYLELAAAWKPYVETTVEAFGAKRCMMESNFPIDGRSCGFVPLWNALKHITRGCSAEDRAALFHGTAMRVYRLDVPALATA